MSVQGTARHCSCGTRLSRHNRTTQCGGCRQRRQRHLLQPPALPEDFWDTNEIQSAFAARHIGAVLRAYRHHPHHGLRPLTQDVVAGWMGQTQAQLSRLENGPPLRNLDRLTAWALLLGMPRHLLWFSLPADEPRPIGKQQLAVTNPGHWHNPVDLNLVRSLRTADRRVGGSHLYAAVTTHLAGLNRSPSFSSGTACDSISKQVLAAAACMSDMAGWMALDAGSSSLAQAHFKEATGFAKRSDDKNLFAQTLASLSHLEGQHGNAATALKHATEGLAKLDNGQSNVRLRARLLALRARGLADAGQVVESVAALVDAEESLTKTYPTASEWLSPYDTTSFAVDAARCFLRIGDLAEAQRRLDRALAEQPAERVRSKALMQLMLVTALLGKGQIDDACAMTSSVLTGTVGLGSAVVASELSRVGVLLRSHSSIPSALLSEVDRTVRERAWIGTVVPALEGRPADMHSDGH